MSEIKKEDNQLEIAIDKPEAEIIGGQARQKISTVSGPTESKEKMDRVAIVVCGPPHSGKSVFFATLKEHLPRQGTHLFRACPDGEGTWSQRAASDVASAIRRKGSFSDEFVHFSEKAIQDIKTTRVLIDVGGLRTPENEAIFSNATHFVVLCRADRPEEREAWEEFGKKAGLTLLASFESVLEGEEDVQEDENGILRGRVSGLERGEHIESQPIEELAHKILFLTPEGLSQELITEEAGIRKINLDSLATHVNVPYQERVIRRGTPQEKVIQNPFWSGQNTHEAVRILSELDPEEPVWLDGAHPAFLYSALSYDLLPRETWLTDFKVESGRMKIPELQAAEKPSDNLIWKTEERDQYTLVEIEIPKGLFDMEKLPEVIPPSVNPDKGVVLSGKLPFLMFTAFVKFYKGKTPWISIYTPQQIDDARLKSPAMVVGSEEQREVGSYTDCPPIGQEQLATKPWEKYMTYGSERFSSTASNNHNVVVTHDTDQIVKLVLGKNVILLLPNDTKRLADWVGYPTHQEAWLPLWFVLLYHSQHRVSDERDFRSELAKSIPNEDRELMKKALLFKAQEFWKEYKEDTTTEEPRKKYKKLTRILQDILLYINIPKKVIQNQQAYLEKHPLHPFIQQANELRRGIGLEKAAELEDSIETELAKLSEGYDTTALEDAYEEVQRRISAAKNPGSVILLSDADISDIDYHSALVNYDFLMAEDEHDTDVVSIVPELEEPQFKQVSVKYGPQLSKEKRMDVIAVPPKLAAWDVAKNAKESYQPIGMIVATHTVPQNEQGRAMQERLQNDYAPQDIAEHYLGAAKEFLHKKAWGKSYAKRIDRDDIPQIKKLIPLHRVARDLLPRAIYMLKTGNYPAGVADEELWAVGETLEVAKRIEELFGLQDVPQEELHELNEKIEEIFKKWFKPEHYETFLSNMKNKMNTSL